MITWRDTRPLISSDVSLYETSASIEKRVVKCYYNVVGTFSENVLKCFGAPSASLHLTLQHFIKHYYDISPNIIKTF